MMCSVASASTTRVLLDPALVEAPTEANDDQVRGMLGCSRRRGLNTTEVWGGLQV